MSPKIWLSSTEGYKLLPKNVAALKTIFHITESLGHLLGEGWHIVLGTVNCLDCILAMPRTIASIQVTTASGIRYWTRCISFPTALSVH